MRGKDKNPGIIALKSLQDRLSWKMKQLRNAMAFNINSAQENAMNNNQKGVRDDTTQQGQLNYTIDILLKITSSR